MNSQSIAIVGLACRYPQSNSIAALWQNLLVGKDCLSRFTKEELLAAGCSERQIHDPSFISVKGILSDIDQFDAQFFDLNPNDAKLMDPQQRLLLECAWEALESSGNVPAKSREKKISVFAGMADSCYLQNNLLKNKWFLQHYNWFQTRVATSMCTLSTQLSYQFNLHGNSISLNTACSTGLVAVNQACRDLSLKESDLALVGAAAIEIPQITGYIYQPDGIDSADGYCRPFSCKANGTVFSNGVGVIVLKRLEDAIADRDTVYAVIKGCGVNNDGHDKLSFVAPSVSGQAECIRLAMDQAGISPKDIGFIETHGTGTALGDLIEITALKKVYEEYTQKKEFCALGSIKSNLGHTDIASGIASLIKATLCLYHKKIPATLHLENPHPDLRLADSPFYINQELITWPEAFRYAAVSAFGVGGTNAHVILEAYTHPISSLGETYQNQLIILSAQTEKALKKTVNNFIHHIDFPSLKNSNELADLAYTLQVGREDFPWRAIGVGKCNNEIKHSLLQFPVNNIKSGKENSRVIFMFPGQGCFYPQVASYLYRKIPFFSDKVDYCTQVMNQYGGGDFSPLTGDKHIQASIFIIEYALAQLLIHWGIQPVALIGHSLGEYAAACLADVLSLEEALFLLFQRGRLVEKTVFGNMLAIDCSVNEFIEYQKIFSIELAAHNTMNQCVATGSQNEIEKLQHHLSQLGKSSYLLSGERAFHSQFMEPIREEFLYALRFIHLSSPRIPMISNLTGDWLTDHQATDPEYWYKHLRYTVQFDKGLDTLLKKNSEIFLEVGPGQTLSAFAQCKMQNLGLARSVFSTLPNRQHPDHDELQLLTTVGKLWQQGVDIHWPEIHEAECRQRIPLPTYPFDHRRYWIEPNMDMISVAEKLPKNQWLFQPSWSRQSPYADSFPGEVIRQYTWVLFKDSLGLADQFVTHLKRFSAHFILIEKGADYQQLDAEHYLINPSKKSDYLQLFDSLKLRINHPLIFLHFFSFTPPFKKRCASEEIVKQLDLSFYSVLYMTQAYIESFGDQPLKSIVITCGTQDPLGGELSHPINATLIGPCRVISKEHPLMKFQLIDVDEQEVKIRSERLISQIFHTCVDTEWDREKPMLVLRYGYQWHIGYIPAQLEKPQAILKDNGVYLLTGGLGGIALSLCEIISKTVRQPVFVLLSRSTFPAQSMWESILKTPEQNHWHSKIQKLKEIQKLGATFIIQSADVTDLESLRASVDSVISIYGAINGMIHSAGVPGGGLTQLKTKIMADAVLAPKIQGAYYLAEVLEGQSLDFVAFCSSVSALIGEPGQVDYCAANACLDAMATAGLFQAKKVVTINWNTWTKVGMAVETERPDDIDFLDRDNHISPQEGQEFFLKIIGSCYSQVAVSTKDIVAYAKEITARDESSNIEMKISRNDLQVSHPYVAPRNLLESQLTKIWQNVLAIDFIGIEDDFFDLGGHSLRALYLVESIKKVLHSTVSLQDVYHEKTIANLAKKIRTQKIVKDRNITVQLKDCKNNASPIFLCHPMSGLIFCYKDLVDRWDVSQSIYGLQDPSVESGHLLFDNLIEMAEVYLQAIRDIQPRGPYYLLGYSFGATLMYEVAHLITKSGDVVEQLVMIDGWAIFSEQQKDENLFKKMVQDYHPELPEKLVQIAWQRTQLLLSHKLSQTDQNIILFKATELLEEYQKINDSYNGWNRFTTGKIICHSILANHESIMDKKNLPLILSRLPILEGIKLL